MPQGVSPGQSVPAPCKPTHLQPSMAPAASPSALQRAWPGFLPARGPRHRAQSNRPAPTAPLQGPLPRQVSWKGQCNREDGHPQPSARGLDPVPSFSGPAICHLLPPRAHCRPSGAPAGSGPSSGGGAATAAPLCGVRLGSARPQLPPREEDAQSFAEPADSATPGNSPRRRKQKH